MEWVYKSLSDTEIVGGDNWGKQRGVLILTLSYFIFIIPISFIEFLPENFPNKELFSLGLFCWHSMIYIVNPFLYGFFWMRIRTATVLMLKDVSGWDWETRSNQSVPWWSELQSTTLSTGTSGEDNK